MFSGLDCGKYQKDHMHVLNKIKDEMCSNIKVVPNFYLQLSAEIVYKIKDEIQMLV